MVGYPQHVFMKPNYVSTPEGWQCLRCNKKFQSEFVPVAHNRVHKPQGYDMKLSNEPPPEHTATCLCYHCKMDRELTGK